MTEADLKNRFILGVESIDWWIAKFPDTARGLVKPCDLIASAKGQSIAIEAKLNQITRKNPTEIVDNDRVVGLLDFRKAQIPNLLKHQKSKGKGLALIGIHLAKRGSFRWTQTRAWLVPVDWIRTQEVWRVGDLDPRCELLWAPGVGWRPKETLAYWCEGRGIMDPRPGSGLPEIR